MINMKATVIVDNIEHNNLSGEWGLCIYIEYNGKTILLDSGASELFTTNAPALGLSLAGVDYAVLSHAHYDHSDGMPYFFRENNHAHFYLRQGCAEDCYKIGDDRKRQYIGIKSGILTDFADRITYVEGDYQLTEGVWLIPHKTPHLEAIGTREEMFRDKPEGWLPDDFSHEQSLVFETPTGLVIFNSCSHSGAANIINEVSATFPDKKVRAIIGGFHLFNKTDDEIHAFAQKLLDTKIEYICTGHCTGDNAYPLLQTALGDKLHRLHVGLVMEF